MIVQLYPNDEAFEFEHGDEHVLWVDATQEQIEVLLSMDWLICTLVDPQFWDEVSEDAGIDYDITLHGVSGAFNIANIMLSKLQGEVLS